MTEQQRLADLKLVREALERLMTDEEMDTYPVFDHLCDLISDLGGDEEEA